MFYGFDSPEYYHRFYIKIMVDYEKAEEELIEYIRQWEKQYAVSLNVTVDILLRQTSNKYIESLAREHLEHSDS